MKDERFCFTRRGCEPAPGPERSFCALVDEISIRSPVTGRYAKRLCADRRSPNARCGVSGAQWDSKEELDE